MPNWTQNKLVFRGPQAELAKVRELLAVDDCAFDFNSVVPMPPILLRVISPPRMGENGRYVLQKEGTTDMFGDNVEATPEEHAEIDSYPQNNWYDWASQNWGTKWPASEVEFTDFGSELEYTFQTAWDAPRAFYAVMERRVKEIAPHVAIRAEARHEGDGYEQLDIVLLGLVLKDGPAVARVD
jgi:hypothetical protein